jgi:flagellar export protein FliJ
VIEATSAVEDARDAYIEKAIEAEILDTLKGRRKDEHKDEVRLDEQKELDEIAVSRHRFKSKGSNGGNEGEDNGEG